MERNRLLWLILERYDLFRPGIRVMHMAPELPFAKRFSELLGDQYYACDVDVARYGSHFTVIRPIDLCTDLVKIPSNSFDLIIHNHVLEHLPCDTEGVLREFERVLAPGGHHFLSVPVSGEETREDLSGDLLPAERTLLFGQADHYRVFGRKSLKALFDAVWGTREQHHIEPAGLFTTEELRRAAIPQEAWSGVGSHTIFHHVRPPTRSIALVAKGSGAQASDAASEPAAEPLPLARRPKLFVHIGMPKAGTTSLQHWLMANRKEALASGLDYWPVAENHSEAMFMALADRERIGRGDMWFQQNPAPRTLDGKSARRALDTFLDGLGERTGFISAEVMWSFPSRDVKRFGAYLRERGIEPALLCWVRPPAEFLRTAAQQRARSSLSMRDFGMEFWQKIFIRYQRLDAWLDEFGRDRMLVQPLGKDIIGQLQQILASAGIDLSSDRKPEEFLNTSISMLAAKAMLALNEAQPNVRQRSRRLQTALREVAGGDFRLPLSVLGRSGKRLQDEADYLSTRFGIDRDWLLGETSGVEDVRFFHWEHDDVVTLMTALNIAMLKLERQKGDTPPDSED
jgi:hypothetical protein